MANHDAGDEVGVSVGEGIPSEDDASFVFTRERIEAHNKSIREFWAEYEPKVAAITEEQARAIIDLGRVQGLPMNLVAERMRGRLDFEIPEGSEIALGGAIYGRALALLDLHDLEFRPAGGRRPMGSVAGMDMFWHADTGELEVVHSGRSGRFRPIHAPGLGVELTDLITATVMAKGFEAEAKSSVA